MSPAYLVSHCLERVETAFDVRHVDHSISLDTRRIVGVYQREGSQPPSRRAFQFHSENGYGSHTASNFVTVGAYVVCNIFKL